MRAARVAVGVLLLLAPASPVGAFDYDTHYLWTYYLALQVGYSPRQAYQIASATFAIDYDPHTGPMEADAFDTIRANPSAEIETVWTRFHAFADARYSQLQVINPMSWLEAVARLDARLEAMIRRRQVEELAVMRGDPKIVAEMRVQNEDALWKIALEEGNPGPYLHFIQDIQAHWGFDSRRGHLTASHAPDYLSFNVGRSRTMTERTIEALQRFADVVRIQRRQVDMDRVWQVFDELVAANPPVWIGQVRYYDELLQAGLTQHLARSDPSIHAMFPSISGIGSPDGAKAWRVVTDAVTADRQFNRLPSFPDVWFERDLPPKWFQYDYDAEGRTGHASVNRDRFAVEWPEIVVGDAQLTCAPEPETRDLVRLTLRVPYEIRGAASLNFQHPLPLYNRSLQSDEGEQKPGTLERENGRYTIERYVLRPRASLDGSAKWTETIAVGPSNERAVVETPLACGAAPRTIGPARIACPVSPTEGPGRHYPDLTPGALGGVMDGTYCRTQSSGTWCSVACEYGPPQAPQWISSSVNKTHMRVNWMIAGTPQGIASTCQQPVPFGYRRQPGSSIIGAAPASARDRMGADGRLEFNRPDPAAVTEAGRLWSALVGEVIPYAMTCPDGPSRPQTSVTKASWTRPTTVASSGAGAGSSGGLRGASEILRPPAPGPTRIMFGGRTVDANYEQQTDGRGVPIDIYFYRTTPPVGAPAPVGEQEWNRFVRVPSAGSNSTEPVVWWHARWEYGTNGWQYIQERGVPPPQAPR